MTTQPLPSVELLRKLLRYEPGTGLLFWQTRPVSMFATTGSGGAEGNCLRWNNRCAGKLVRGGLSPKGYRVLRIQDWCVPAHRVIWAMTTGEWPTDQIDHINGDKSDNRASNLREVNNSENCRNRPIRIDNTSGVQGVTFHVRMRKWQARIAENGREKTLGTFADKEEAIAARKAAELRLGYHINHGRAPQPPRETGRLRELAAKTGT